MFTAMTMVVAAVFRQPISDVLATVPYATPKKAKSPPVITVVEVAKIRHASQKRLRNVARYKNVTRIAAFVRAATLRTTTVATLWETRRFADKTVSKPNVKGAIPTLSQMNALRV